MATHDSSSSLVRFGDCELDLQTGELCRNGTSLRLQPQPAKILTMLVSRAGEVVTRQELAQEVWGSDTFVDFEQGLNFAIRQIRAALEDDPETPRFLETLPKRGYRFTAPVSNEAARAAVGSPAPVGLSSPDPRKVIPRYAFAFLIIAATAAVLMFAIGWRHLHQPQSGAANSPAIASLAVLPLHNLSRDPDEEYFSDGMTDELITELAKVGKLRLISHTSVERYKETKRPLPEIARELGVDAVVEGTVMRSGNRVRITAQLIDARSDQHLWAQSYERDLRDVLALQDEVAQRIATEIGINLTTGEQARLASPRVVDPAAHEAYLRGNFYWSRLNCDGSRKGLEYFQQAVAKDPHFAPAYVGVAQAYFTLGDWGCSPREVFAKSKSAALKATELDPGLGPAHAWLGILAFFYEWEWQNAEKELKQAIELDPSYVPAHLSYAVFLVTMARRDEGFAELKRARELDPTSELTNMMSVHVLYLARQYDQAIEQAKTAVDLYPGSNGTYFWLGASYERKSMYEQASAAFLQADALDGASPRDLDALRNAYRKSGIRGFWQQEIVRANGNKSDACWATIAYAHMGERERTLESLNLAFEQHCTVLRMVIIDPVYDSLRNDPRFKALITRLRL